MQGQELPIRQFYQGVLEQTSKAVTDEDLFTKVNENTLRRASVREVNESIPLPCSVSIPPAVMLERWGSCFISAGMREDNAKLLDAPVDELGAVLDEKDDSPRRAILYFFGSMQPSSPTKAIKYLKMNLENSRNSNEEIVTVAASLLKRKPRTQPHCTKCCWSRLTDPMPR